MTHPTARVLALLEILQADGVRTAGELAERLDVDERTVRRYVAQLVELDIPVRSTRGRYGGYRLAPGYRMPPLMLTDEEALAVLVGLLATRRSGTAATSAVAVESAAAKLRRVLPLALAARLETLEQTVAFTARPRTAAVPETDVLLLLARAARDRSPVALHYTDREGRHSERTLQPYGIVAHAARWYVTGADSASGEVRLFRLDRITAPTVLAGTFDVPGGFEPAARVLSALAAMPHRYDVAVRVHGTVDEVRARLPPAVATVVLLADDGPWVRVRIGAERLDWVPAVLAGLGRRFVVEQPEELRALVRELGSRLLDAADTDQPKNASTA